MRPSFGLQDSYDAARIRHPDVSELKHRDIEGVQSRSPDLARFFSVLLLLRPGLGARRSTLCQLKFTSRPLRSN